MRLVELKGGGDLYAPGAGEVLVEVELLLQLGELLVGEVGPTGVVNVQEGVGEEGRGLQADAGRALHARPYVLQGRGRQLWGWNKQRTISIAIQIPTHRQSQFELCIQIVVVGSAVLSDVS